MSDQFGNTVDGEIRVPIKELWKPHGTAFRDFHDIGSGGSGIGVKEYTIAYADGRTREAVYEDEGDARVRLQRIRSDLKGYGIPEDYHPILMVRDVTTNYSSWKPLNV